MNAATEFDIGPLTWVKSEIDLALGRARQALDNFAAATLSGSAELTEIKFCRTHLHQVQGALTIVGLDGVTQFTEAIEGLLEGVETQAIPAGEASVTLARRGLDAIGHYLDDLIDGQPNQPLRLLTIYREIQTMRGKAHVSATDLFYPDLSLRPQRRTVQSKAMAPGEFRRMLRNERARFQRGFLSWLRSPQDKRGIGEMLGVVKRIEETQEIPSSRSFWWVASGFLSALAEGDLPEGTDIKQLCARIDLQIRRLYEGSKNVAERLMRDALYFVATADSQNEAVRQVKETYRLQSAIPDVETAAPPPEEAIRRRLREMITATEEVWNKYCAGSASALPLFRDNAATLATLVAELGHTDYKRLAQAISAAANWLSENSSRHSEMLAMEIATAILLTQNAQENFQRLGSDFAHQVDVMVARIHGCLSGQLPAPGSEIPLLDEMSRRAQEKLLVAQVAKEIQNNLGQIEQVLDGFFRDATRRATLDSLEIPLRQVIGALSMMRHESAVAVLRNCAAEIKRFSGEEYAPRDEDYEHVASQLSMLGFFVDALVLGETDYETFSRRMESGLPGEANDGEELAEPDQGGFVEQEVAQQKLETRAMLGALKENPQDQELRMEVKQSLAALKQDAELLADNDLGDQAEGVLAALDADHSDSPQIDEAIASFKPPVAEVPQPSAETVQLAQVSTEELDAELLEIFLEEANEVIGTIGISLEELYAQPHNVEVLTTIRRSFHTLKGSGRMVGLKDLGEVAWSIEQTLNLWLRQERVVNEALLELLSQAHTLFSAWVAHLASREGAAPDAANLIVLSEQLRAGDPSQEKPASHAEGQMPPPAASPAIISEVPETAEIPEHTAQIIPLAFPGAQTDGVKTEVTPEITAIETIELGDFDFNVPHDEDIPPVETVPAMQPEAVADLSVEAGATIRQSIPPALYAIFSEEAKIHIGTLQREYGILQEACSNPTPPAIYRAAHTLAGISGTVGISPINRLAQALERALLRRDNSDKPESLEALGIIGQAIGELELMFSMLEAHQEPVIPFGVTEALEGLYPVKSALSDPLTAAEDSSEDADETPALLAGASSEIDFLREQPSGAVPVSDEIDEQLLPIFLEEAADLDEGITAQLRAWRADPEDEESVRVLTRLLHTLKGSARMAGAMNLGEMAHAIETRVEQASATGKVTLESIEEIHTAFDEILHGIECLQRGEAVPVSAASGETTVAEKVESQPPGARAVEESVPEVVQERRADRLRTAETDEAGAQKAMLRVRADLVDRLVNEAGELSIARARIEGEMRSLKGSLLDLTENVIRLRRQLREIEIQAESQMQSRTAQAAEEQHAGFDPLEFDRFTRFQELTRMMAESVNDVATVQQNLLKNLDDANAAIIAQARLNREVQQELMSVRMLPFGSLADRLYRIARQTSKELNKRVNLEITGGQVELDRGVLDKLGAPLEHMLRNAIAHGLETQDVRKMSGKPEIGEVSLSLVQEGNEIILSFSDDGAGLDLERIREQAIRAGLLEEGANPEPEQLADYIFAPGFSTASELSQVAGRGIGMDVVKTEVGSIGGRIETITSRGKGTEFRLYIPLTLAVTKALLVRAGGKRYAVPSTMIEQVLDLKEAPLARIREAGMAEWMNHHYPFSYLPHLLGETQALPEQHRQYWILLLRSGSRRISVQVDELLGNEEIVVKNIGPQLARVIGVDGATVLGDGEVVLILNPVALSSRTPATEFIAPVPAIPGAGPDEAEVAILPTVMVVDDSLTVRKITSRLLEREGYQVVLAKDGVDALEKLLDIVPDVMLVDIEMPRMDGFDLTRNIRADGRLKEVPIIMITSRTAEKHRNYAFEIGVNDYLGKPYQEDELLRLVAGYVKEQRQA